MLLDRSQRGWAFGSLGMLAAALAIYVPYAVISPAGPRGGSGLGLMFGAAGFAFMLYAAALGARKRVPTWRLGRAKAWMRGHLWLGLLALPMILFHGGFHFGGTLTRVLMWLLIVTVASGIYGAVLQHLVPRKMTSDVPLETIYDEIAQVRALLAAEAGRTVEALCGGFLPERETDLTQGTGKVQRAGGFTALRPITASAAPLRTSAAVSAGASAAVAPAAEIPLLALNESEPLRSFYLRELQPFLDRPNQRGSRLADQARAAGAFSALRTALPAAAHQALEDLAGICDEARQLRRQERLHRWLHGWLLAHIPLSLALIVLGAVHAVMALRW
ncbi:MAG TPA: hypothetical protein VKB24_01035 [Candidatus Acidoferrum sp.]|nr:hypothetical protein [Candidatus Acidoferrum sp.]